MEQIMGYLTWNQNEQMEVNTSEELDQLLDHLTQVAEQEGPFSVELSVGPESGMSIVLGLPESHAEFYSAQDHPPVVGCQGDWSSNEIIAFSHRGQYSELPKRYWILAAKARKALHQYFRTGVKPDNITWNN